MAITRARIESNLSALEAMRKDLLVKIQIQENNLSVIRDSHRIVKELGEPVTISGSSQQQSCTEFAMQEELNRLHFQLDEHLLLIAQMKRLLTRSCATCKGVGTVTYTPDGMDQLYPITTLCPTCHGVSVTASTQTLLPQPNGC